MGDRLRRAALLAVLLAPLTAIAPPLPAGAAGGPVIAGCPIFPADNVWNTDVSTLPVHSRSAAWLASSGGASRLLHPDWGPSGGAVPYGMPWQVVNGSHPKVAVTFLYAAESDPGPYPLGLDTLIEGGANSTGDRHALVMENDTCTLYETYATSYAPGASTAGSGAIFNLRSNALRPATWTSADAAGLPILPGLVRLSEVNAGAIHHAIRFTVQRTDRSYLWPARHQAGAANDPSLPPMGARFRMKANVDTSHYSAAARVVLTAMKHYGLIVADNGSNWYFQGDADPGWGYSVIGELKTIPAGDFEAVDESSLMVSSNSARARQPAGAPPAPPPPPPVARPPAAPSPTAPPHPAAASTMPTAPASAVAAGPVPLGPSPAAVTVVVPRRIASLPPPPGAGATARVWPVAALVGGAGIVGGGTALTIRRRRRTLPFS